MNQTAICQTCNQTFNVGLGCIGYYCSRKCNHSAPVPKCCSLLTKKEVAFNKLNEHEISYLSKLKKCANCNNATLGKFCCRSCSVTFNNQLNPKRKKTAESKLTIVKKEHKIKLPMVKEHIPYTKIYFCSCSICVTKFVSIKKKTYCSDGCFLSIKRKNAAGTKKVEYNGKTFDSLWEVETAKYLDANNVEWIQPSIAVEWIDSLGKTRKYFPDFFLPKFNLYLDPKNKLVVIKQQEKLNYVSTKINLIYGDMKLIKESIDYLIQ